MSAGTTLASLLWFVLILAMVPAALWLLKRTPLGGGGLSGGMRLVGNLALSPNQRLVTVEVGEGDERRWLVLGVTPQTIATLHILHTAPVAPPAPAGDGGAPAAFANGAQTPFAQMLRKWSAPKPASRPEESP